MIIKDNMANMCAKVTSTYMEFTLAFGPKPEFSFSFKSEYMIHQYSQEINIFSNVCSVSVRFFCYIYYNALMCEKVSQRIIVRLAGHLFYI